MSYRTNRDDLVVDFYVPCLKLSTLYRRAAGYFSSSGLALAARGVASLAARKGEMRLVVSPHLESADIRALRLAADKPQEILKSIVGRELGDIEEAFQRDRLNALAWLAATGILKVKIAFRVNEENDNGWGLYHEKVGVFSDSEGNHVAFSGSANETAGGMVNNFECVDVYQSWNDSEGRVKEKILDFDNLWSDQTQEVRTVEFTSISIELLEKFRDPHNPPEGLSVKDLLNEKKDFRRRGDLELRDYQNEAIRNWFRADGRGVFKMATGSGKTITSLSTAATLHEKIKLQALVIVCPYRHLVTQWADEAKSFGLKPIMAFNARSSWQDKLNHELILASSDETHFFAVITTNTTFANVYFQEKLAHLPKKTMLIADEVHNMGARGNWDKMPKNVRFRLGLSATPERHGDEEGSQAIFDYFGPIVKPEFTLKDALDSKALTPYRYYPILVEFTDEETERYFDLSERIAKIASFASIESEERSPHLDALLSQRARLIACAENKLPALRELMADKLTQKQMLFYCGDGRVEFEPESELIRHIEAVCALLGHELGMRVAKFVAETSLDEREQLKENLATGTLQGLVAIRCLDEGVDIPSIQSAVILASSTNPRQFVQRRGRILRKSAGKDSADIYDMVVVPPDGGNVNEIERKLIRRELTRFAEFADLSLNAGQARAIILDIQERFHLLDI